MPTEQNTEELQETSDINLATFIHVVKHVASAGHFFRGKQLLLQFAIPKEEMQSYTNDYINSIHARCDSTRRNFLRLLKK